MWYRKLLLIPLDRIYLWLCGPVLLVMVYILPPFQSPDEVAHYYRAIQVSHGEIMPMLVENSYRPAAGGLVEKSAMGFAAHYCINPATWICPRTDRPRLVEIFSKDPVERNPERQLAAFSNTVIYLPIAHVIPAAAIVLARSLRLTAEGWFYAGRLANVLFSIAATWLALRLVRGCGADLLLFVLATLPMTISILPTLSADAAVISCSFLLLAMSLRLLSEGTLAAWLWPVLIATVPFATVAKIAYLPLAFIPSACAYAGRARSRVLFATFFIAVATLAVTLLWSSQVQAYVFPIAGDPRVDVDGQLAFLRSRPMFGLEVLLSSMMMEAPKALLTLVGWKLSGNTLSLPLALLVPALFVLAIALAIGGSDRPRRMLRAFVLIVMLAAATSTFLFLYIQNNKIGAGRVRTYQGRYLLPILPFAALVVPTLNPGGPERTMMLRAMVIITSLAGCLALAIFLALRTWQ